MLSMVGNDLVTGIDVFTPLQKQKPSNFYIQGLHQVKVGMAGFEATTSSTPCWRDTSPPRRIHPEKKEQNLFHGAISFYTPYRVQEDSQATDIYLPEFVFTNAGRHPEKGTIILSFSRLF